MRAALMRQEITIVQPGAAGQDQYGEPAPAMLPAALVFQTWAQIAAVTSREVYALGAGFTGQVTHKVTMRWTATPIAAGMQVLYDGRTFEVQSVSDPTEMRRELDLMCQELTK